MSTLQGASNVIVTGGQFTSLSVKTAGSSKGLELLREHCTLGGLLNSNERFDPPRCDEDTRVAIIAKIMNWITNDRDEASMMILRGSAGAGKSALEQSIAEMCQKRGLLAAAFFFSRTAVSRSNGDALIPTLAYQLLHTIPGLRSRIEEEINDDFGIFDLTREVQMERLVLKPLQPPQESSLFQRLSMRLLNKPSTAKEDVSNWPRLIAIDGLDECDDPSVQCDILRIIATLIPRLPFPFRFLVSCRPESHILHTLRHHPSLQAIDVAALNLEDDPDTNADISTFLQKGFQGIRKTHPLGRHLGRVWPTSFDMRILLTNSSRHFIFASTVINYVGSPKHRPDDRLDTVLRVCLLCTHEENPLAQLDNLYSHIFSCVRDIGTALRVLGVIKLVSQGHVEYNPVSDRHLTAATLENIFMLRPGDIELAMDELRSLVNIPSRDEPIQILHASLFDFLGNPARSGAYFMDIALAHETLAKWQWSQIDLQALSSQRIVKMRNFLFHCRLAPDTQELQELLLKASMFALPFLRPYIRHYFADKDEEEDLYFYFKNQIDILQLLNNVVAKFFTNVSMHKKIMSNIAQTLRDHVKGFRLSLPSESIFREIGEELHTFEQEFLKQDVPSVPLEKAMEVAKLMANTQFLWLYPPADDGKHNRYIVNLFTDYCSNYCGIKKCEVDLPCCGSVGLSGYRPILEALRSRAMRHAAIKFWLHIY